MPFKFNEYMTFDAMRLNFRLTADFRQVDDERSANDLAAGLAH